MADERGSVIVEFLGVAVLSVLALLAIVQLAVWVWARNVAFDAAHEGARLAAQAGHPLDAGVTRARALLHDGLGGAGSAFAVDAGEERSVVVVIARGAAPVIMPFLPHFTITARATAFDEDGVFG